ncbi:hypothetical protein CALCODRAFT_498137 [Calocera cornea HHB12733]|uniref:Uncharacterized protein n=1 Tax=Calocera cornea HHB12733 TaxID=1353952 RepID=A0A165EYR8_9BASI|nr:hypothetical protein CALCODRAFT_498137 [Calocera cornea HHB12733]
MENQPQTSYAPPANPPPPGYAYSGINPQSKTEEAGFPPQPLSKDEESGYGHASKAGQVAYIPDQEPDAYNDGFASLSNVKQPPKDVPAPEYTEADAAALWPNLPPRPVQKGQKLPLPVAVPQLTGNFDSMFVRAYCPQLEAAGVGMQEWVDFCDGLNLAIVASPPLRVVDKVGLIIGFVPNEWAMIAGTVMQFVAQTGMAVLSKRLTDRYLRRVNREYFEPRGLRVRLCRTAAMRALVGKDDSADLPHKAVRVAKSIGREVENVVLKYPILPGTGKLFELMHKPLAPVDAHSELSVTERRLADMTGLICPLSFDVPAPKKPTDLVGRMNELAVKMDRNMALNDESRAVRTRRLLEIRQGIARAPSSHNGSSGSAHTGYASAPPAPFGQQPLVASPAPYGPQGYASPPEAYGYPSYPSYSPKQHKKALKESLKAEKRARKEELRAQRRGMPFSLLGPTQERREVKDEEKYMKAELKARKDVMKGRKPRAWYLQDEVKRVDRLEYNMTLELIWIVVLNAEQDEAIKDKEQVDSAEDVEYVPEEEFEEEVEREEEEDEEFALGEREEEGVGPAGAPATLPVRAQ